MKKVLVSICMVSAVLVMSSCRTVEKAVSLSSISGEWNIVEVNGAKVVSGENRTAPFIGFDTTEGRVHGSSGCNRMMGSFDVNSTPGTLEFKGMGSTRMMCPDMTTENNVLNALAQVKSYQKAGKNKMYLCNASKRPVMMLEKKAADPGLSSLNGEWLIQKVHGEAIPTGMEKQPFIKFNVKDKTIHGCAGCNLMNGGFVTSVENAEAISFPAVMSTMMACPDMEVEGKVMKALNEVQSFKVQADGTLALYDASNGVALSLKKK
ncbi:META domain-containing protein [Bacteroides reticulotermitis]|nr:META domain-containing protein [Bacteroides reticulotermitis]MBB4042834.1 heat shock protein HslJ [Bacteroides reticulotermitis]HJD75701.1 META domain-containing protein [Bacteroides reticulotermitis]